jgi:hypothetical protein
MTITREEKKKKIIKKKRTRRTRCFECDGSGICNECHDGVCGMCGGEKFL